MGEEINNNKFRGFTEVHRRNECLVELEIVRFFSLENSSISFFNSLLSRV